MIATLYHAIHRKYTQWPYTMTRKITKGKKMSDKKKEKKNIIFVSIFIGSMLLFMLGTVIYVTSQVANCSSVKKARKLC